ncbi:hypothetical protein DGMP_18700 [Desulfomarina profundi]|uniref:Uncharacterized protein n=1 Tax=Desulfomarina profundi TaxID=2772557 RepID=A0A8D5JM35_9BACT|nr:hypothetical protein [Desulfomarina profundi]BCL61177.1 hypothetical protein DGMP_18700 [Desulfomarina profundi]
MQSRVSVILLALYTFLFLCGVDLFFWHEECGANTGKYKVVTKHTSLVFNSREDMVLFNNAIDYEPNTSLSDFFSSSNSLDQEKELIRKVDLLFEKVQAILDMRKRMRKVRVRLFSNSDQLKRAYRKIFGKKCHIRGWYVYDFNTVFLNVRDVHEGMLAHELGHAIIDHYLTVRPPRATAEILAKYVDKHLFDEVKTY